MLLPEIFTDRIQKTMIILSHEYTRIFTNKTFKKHKKPYEIFTFMIFIRADS